MGTFFFFFGTFFGNVNSRIPFCRFACASSTMTSSGKAVAISESKLNRYLKTVHIHGHISTAILS
jgi:hypothetical protein